MPLTETVVHVIFVLIKTLHVTDIAFLLFPSPQRSCNFPYLECGESKASSEDKARFGVCFGGGECV
jgi:hypothetical protein